jgi:sec-independent protein translocase protein TatA
MIPGLPQVGGVELLILLSIILILFGAKRIPSLARSLGSGLGEFRKGVSGNYDNDVEDGKERLPREVEASR